MTKPKTVKVRIAVAVDYEGNYVAFGENDVDDDGMIELTGADNMMHGHQFCFITAELPIPSIPEVQGEVEVVDCKS